MIMMIVIAIIDHHYHYKYHYPLSYRDKNIQLKVPGKDEKVPMMFPQAKPFLKSNKTETTNIEI